MKLGKCQVEILCPRRFDPNGPATLRATIFPAPVTAGRHIDWPPLSKAKRLPFFRCVLFSQPIHLQRRYLQGVSAGMSPSELSGPLDPLVSLPQGRLFRKDGMNRSINCVSIQEWKQQPDPEAYKSNDNQREKSFLHGFESAIDRRERTAAKSCPSSYSPLGLERANPLPVDVRPLTGRLDSGDFFLTHQTPRREPRHSVSATAASTDIRP